MATLTGPLKQFNSSHPPRQFEPPPQPPEPGPPCLNGISPAANKELSFPFNDVHRQHGPNKNCNKGDNYRVMKFEQRPDVDVHNACTHLCQHSTLRTL